MARHRGPDRKQPWVGNWWNTNLDAYGPGALERQREYEADEQYRREKNIRRKKKKK